MYRSEGRADGKRTADRGRTADGRRTDSGHTTDGGRRTDRGRMADRCRAADDLTADGGRTLDGRRTANGIVPVASVFVVRRQLANIAQMYTFIYTYGDETLVSWDPSRAGGKTKTQCLHDFAGSGH